MEWTLGRTSILTPTAVFDPVEIEGTKVSRASLHNVSIMKSFGLTKNCTIRVFKANQIIPQVDSADKDGDAPIKVPAKCPICGGDTSVRKDNESEVLICTNPECAGKKLAQFAHFASRQCMNIDGLSEKTLELLISHGFLHTYRDIFHLSEYKNEITMLEGLGKKSVTNLLKSIEDARNIKLENFIAALGIPNIGLSAAKTISNHFQGNYSRFIEAWRGCFAFAELNDFGVIMSESLDDYLCKYINEVEALAEEMHFIIESNLSSSTNLNGKNFCVTGSLSYYANRDALINAIEDNGGKYISSVSKKIDYLINNDKASTSGKNKKAIDLNIPIISEKDFISMIGGHITK